MPAEYAEGFRVNVRSAGLSRGSELKIALACNLLVASNIQVDLQPWDGTPCDLLIVDLNDAHGRHAHEIASRGQGRILTFAEENQATTALMPHMPVAMIEKALRTALVAAPRDSPSMPDSSLLAICRRTTAATWLIRRGPFNVVLCRRTGRIRACMHSDLLAAQLRATQGAWQAMPVARETVVDGTWEVSKSLDAFLIDTCRIHEAGLPELRGTYQLQAWPDLGDLRADPEALRFSLLLMSTPWSVDRLAARCRTSLEHTNAFCWATLASGLLVEVAPQRTGTYSSAAAPGSTAATMPSVLQRLARRFGLQRADIEAEGDINRRGGS